MFEAGFAYILSKSLMNTRTNNLSRITKVVFYCSTPLGTIKKHRIHFGSGVFL